MNESSQQSSFANTPVGWASRLSREFEAARKALKPWHEQAERAISEYLDERPSNRAGDTKLNIYTADTQTKEAILYGNPPRAVVSRRFADADDDNARVAAEILERLLNADIEGDDDSFAQAFGYAHSDRRHTSFGLCRIRYDMGAPVTKPGVPAMMKPGMDGMPGMEMAPAVPPVETRPDEQVETDWVHWKDVLWNACRVWHEVGLLSFRNQMTREKLVEKFGKAGEEVPLNSKKDKARDENAPSDPWDRADVWETWVKDVKQVFWYVDGHPTVLIPVEGAEQNGGVADPLKLDGFWPCPRPMFGNVTTSKLVPRPDREIAKDQYDEINTLATRLKMLEESVLVRGAYDAGNPELGRILDINGEMLIPVKNWAMFGEKGGIKGAIDWFPVGEVVNALAVLKDHMAYLKDGVRELTGMADIMRGASDGSGTATESRIKARFGSVRMEKEQKELARFASDLQRLRGEVIAKHFDESTILARCNCEFTADAQLAPEAVKLIKSNFAKYRIEVKPEAISMTDFDALKQERTEVIGSISQYLSAAAPLAQAMPGSMPFLLQILQASVAGLRGSSEMEGILDQAIQAAQQAAKQPQQQAPPDPKLQTQQLKGQQDMQKVKAELEADVTRAQVDVEADNMREQNQMRWNVQEHAAKTQITNAFKPKEPVGGGGGRP